MALTSYTVQAYLQAQTVSPVGDATGAEQSLGSEMECDSPLAPNNCRVSHVSSRAPRKFFKYTLTVTSYLAFEFIIRVCIELRLHVAVGFAGIEIPSGAMLIIGDLLLLFLVISMNESMVMRLKLDHGFRHTLYIWFVGVSCTAVALLAAAERIFAVVSGVKWGFAWHKPAWTTYALVRTLYCSLYLELALVSFAVAFLVVAKNNNRTREHSVVDLCGMVCYESP